MRHFPVLAFLFALLTVCYGGEFKLGVDVLEEKGFAPLADKKVGLVANPTSVNSSLVSTVDVLKKTDRCKLVAIFGPEHGVYGDEYAGVKVGDRTDKRTGLPIYSLYGKTRKPTPEMLKGLDALVFDLQDIGSRSYTYISSMKSCLEACAEAGIEFVVLDRPNPLGGERIEGPAGVEKPFESFISALNVPYLHGMTMGELAQLVKDDVAPHYTKLTVIPMEGWKRTDTWAKTGLRWVPTSPHIPQASTCAFYAATGILGELGQVSIGVGYPQPFELVGAPWIHGHDLTRALNDFWSSAAGYYRGAVKGEAINMESTYPRGIHFKEVHYKPFYALFKDQSCEGVQIYLDDDAESLTEIQFRILAALDAPKLFKQASGEGISMFDKSCGSDEPRKWLAEGRDLRTLFEKWRTACQTFREKRARYLLYGVEKKADR
jgi:uncharacterized protein YbbC (DUF1343 family)